MDESPSRAAIVIGETRKRYQQRLQQVNAKIEVISTLVDNIDRLRDMHKELDADFAILEQSQDLLRDMRDGLEAEQGILDQFLSES
jgi:hypothetical protein